MGCRLVFLAQNAAYGQELWGLPLTSVEAQARMTFDPPGGEAPLRVMFDASGSTASEGAEIVEYH